MSYESNIAVSEGFFAGEDRILSYEVFSAGSITTMEDVTSFLLQWDLRKVQSGVDPFRAQGAVVVTKDRSSGITVTGTFNSARVTNTQRVLVQITDVDTQALPGGRYVCALKRMDEGYEAVLSHGTVELLVAAVR